MSKTTLILVIVAATLLASHVSSQPIAPTFRLAFCRNEEYGNFTANSTYEDNLKTVLTELAGNASTQVFHNTSAGSVHGQYYCRGDVSAEFCSLCILQASLEALNCSNAKAATIWYNECNLRYMNESLYGVNYGRPILRTYSLSNQTQPDDFTPVLNETVSGLIQQAAHGDGSIKYFATEEKAVSPFKTAYFLAQCSPDLSETQCEWCLLSAYNATRTCCGEWPKFLYAFPQGCQVMYDTNGIFYFTANAPPTPAPPPSLSSEPPTPESETVFQTPPPPALTTATPTTGGSAALKSNEIMKLGIISLALVLLMLVLHT